MKMALKNKTLRININNYETSQTTVTKTITIKQNYQRRIQNDSNKSLQKFKYNFSAKINREIKLRKNIFQQWCKIKSLSKDYNTIPSQKRTCLTRRMKLNKTPVGDTII